MNPPFVSIPQVDVAPALYEFLVRVVSSYPFYVSVVRNIIGFLVGLAIPLSILFFIVIVYSVEQMKLIRKRENAIYETPAEPAMEVDNMPDLTLSRRWDKVTQHIDSNNPNDWRQAIIESDIILDSLLSKMGYAGATVGEKLQRVSKGDFASIDDAWSAHIVRNKIAHEGSDFDLNHVEAKRAIGSYRKVFEEFYYI